MVLIENIINGNGSRKPENITLFNLPIISGTEEHFLPDGSNTAGDDGSR